MNIIHVTMFTNSMTKRLFLWGALISESRQEIVFVERAHNSCGGFSGQVQKFFFSVNIVRQKRFYKSNSLSWSVELNYHYHQSQPSGRQKAPKCSENFEACKKLHDVKFTNERFKVGACKPELRAQSAFRNASLAAANRLQKIGAKVGRRLRSG